MTCSCLLQQSGQKMMVVFPRMGATEDREAGPAPGELMDLLLVWM